MYFRYPGMSGQYPDSKDVHEFRDNLFNKIDMVSCDSRRWEPGHPEIPQRTGKLYDIAKFDAGFFGKLAMFFLQKMIVLIATLTRFRRALSPSHRHGPDGQDVTGSSHIGHIRCGTPSV